MHEEKLAQQAETCNSTDRSKCVINLSSHDIEKDEKELLEKGLNYSITPTTIPAVELVAKIETVLAGMPTEEADTIHADLSSVICRTQAQKPNCTRNQIAALKSLQQNDNIIILPADKGRATVILNKEDYIRKCNEHLENGPYIKIKKDPTSSVVSQITRKLSVLKRQQINRPTAVPQTQSNRLTASTILWSTQDPQRRNTSTSYSVIHRNSIL